MFTEVAWVGNCSVRVPGHVVSESTEPIRYQVHGASRRLPRFTTVSRGLCLLYYFSLRKAIPLVNAYSVIATFQI